MPNGHQQMSCFIEPITTLNLKSMLCCLHFAYAWYYSKLSPVISTKVTGENNIVCFTTSLACADFQGSRISSKTFLDCFSVRVYACIDSRIARVKSLRRKDNKAWQTRCLSHGGDWLAAGERYLGRVLRRGLGSRATLVVSRCKHKDQVTI